MIHFVDGESELFLDEALSPILVLIWIGPATLELTAKFQRWSDEQSERAKRLARPVIMVHDGSAADRPPSNVRRAFAEHKGDPEVVHRSFVVVTNPLVRGAMTAIGWLIGDTFDVVSCKTMAEALTQAAAYARAQGLVPPSDGELLRYAARSDAQSA